MATTAASIKTNTSISRRLLIGGAVLLVTFILSGIGFFYSFWLGLVVLFAGLVVTVYLSLESHQARGLWLLLITSLFTAILAGSLAQVFLLNSPAIARLAETDETANFFFGSVGAIFLTSTLIGLVAAVVLVILPFLALAALAAVGVLQWRDGENVSFVAAVRYLLASVLGLPHVAITVEDGKTKGMARDLERFETFGGPGWLQVGPGYVVVLKRRGKISRAVGVGSTMLRAEEGIKAILPLTTTGNVNSLENVLTRDRIPLKLKVLHVVQVEPAAETKKRLQDEVDRLAREKADKALQDQAQQWLAALENDKLVGDDYDQCYESIALRAATKAPDIWEGVKGSVANNIKDLFMTCDFEDLFRLGDESGELDLRINSRKIAEIESKVLSRAKASGLEKGVLLKTVDMNEIRFPDMVEERIISEATALAEERIKQTEARTKEATARIEANVTRIEADAKSIALTTNAKAEQVAAEYKAQAIMHISRAEAEADVIEGRAKAEAKAEHYRQILQVVRGLSTDVTTINAVLRNLTSAASLESEVRQLRQLLLGSDFRESRYNRRERSRTTSSEEDERVDE